MRERRFYGTALAVSLAAIPYVFTAFMMNGYCYPGCVIWTDSNPEWYLFLCYLCGFAG